MCPYGQYAVKYRIKSQAEVSCWGCDNTAMNGLDVTCASLDGSSEGWMTNDEGMPIFEGSPEVNLGTWTEYSSYDKGWFIYSIDLKTVADGAYDESAANQVAVSRVQVMEPFYFLDREYDTNEFK